MSPIEHPERKDVAFCGDGSCPHRGGDPIDACWDLGHVDGVEYVRADVHRGAVVRIEALEVIAGANENTMRQWEGEAKRLRHQLAGAVDERDSLREVLRAVLMEPDPIKRNQLAAPVLTNPGGQ
jgi:hypothetical protein